MLADVWNLRASALMAGPAYDGMHGFSVCLTFQTAAEAKRAYDAFAKGGKVGPGLHPDPNRD